MVKSILTFNKRKIKWLWILDEKLVFHDFAASDLSISKIMDETSSKKRPDIVVCTDTQDGVVNETMMYYCYAICDIDKKVETLLLNYSFTKLPLGTGYFHYNAQRNAFIEVRAYDQIVKDVIGRHKSFFNKLGI